MLLLSFGEGEFVCAPRDLYRGCTVRYIIISCISRCPVAVTNTWPKQFKGAWEMSQLLKCLRCQPEGQNLGLILLKCI